MEINKLLHEKKKMERLVASAVYEFELATDFKARVTYVNIDHTKPDGTNVELVTASADVRLPDRIIISNER